MSIQKRIKNLDYCPQPKPTTNTKLRNQAANILGIEGFTAKIVIAAISSLAFVVLSTAVGFSSTTGRDFRVILTLGSLLFAVPFGFCVYTARSSLVGFGAFGVVFLLSRIAGASIVNTILYSLCACLGLALLSTAVKVFRKAIRNKRAKIAR